MIKVQMQRPSFMRRTFLIDRPLQLKYFALFAWVGGGITAMWCTVLYLVRSQIEVTEGAVSRDVLLWWYVLAVVGIGWFVGILGLLVTHRIAGPAYVMTGLLERLAEGQYPAVRSLRKGDDLKGLFAGLTKVVERLRRDDAELVLICERVLATVEAGSPEAKAALGALTEFNSKRRLRVESKGE